MGQDIDTTPAHEIGPDHPLADVLKKASTLSEALPYLKSYSGRTFVIKYGGHAMGTSDLAAAFAEDVVLLQQVGIQPIIVHGGGPQIAKMLQRLDIESSFIDGLRITDEATMEVAEMVLSGAINKQVVAAINAAGGRAVGLSGKDANLVTARQVRRTHKDPDSSIERVVDLGQVGEPATVDTSVLDSLRSADFIPVIAPVAPGPRSTTFNINADTMAGAIAAACHAARLFLLTDVPGVLDSTGGLMSDLSPNDIAQLIADGVVKGGMVPKVKTCVQAVENSVEAAVILDGRVPHAMLLEIFTQAGAGTLVRR